MLCHPGMHAAGARKARATLDGIAIGTAVMVLSWTLVLERLWHHTDLSTARRDRGAGLPVRRRPHHLPHSHVDQLDAGRRSPAFVLGPGRGCFAMAVSDSTYAYLVEVNKYSTGNLVDVGWVVAYSPSPSVRLATTAGRPRRDGPKRLSLAPPQFAAPFVPVLAGSFGGHLQHRASPHVDRFEWLTAFGLALLVVVRQALAAVGPSARAVVLVRRWMEHGRGTRGGQRARWACHPNPSRPVERNEPRHLGHHRARRADCSGPA